MATTNDDMQKSVKAAEAESAKASETRVTASETTAPVNSDARAVAEPTAPVSKDAPAVANTQDAQPNLNAEEVQAEVDAELEALFAEADADEIPDAAQEVLLAQADDSADDAPAEEGEGEGESADGSAAGDGAMGAGQIGLIGLGLAAAAAAGGGGGSSSPSTGSSSEQTGDITSSTDSAVTDNGTGAVEFSVTSIPDSAIEVNAPNASSVTFKFTGDAADGTVVLGSNSVLVGDVTVDGGTVDVTDANISGVTSLTANSAVVITPTQLESLQDSNDNFSISSNSAEQSTFTLELKTDDDVAAFNELVAEGGIVVTGSGADTFVFNGSVASDFDGDDSAATTAIAKTLSALQEGDTFTLTTSASDDLEGTANADSFDASEINYLESSDSVDGKGSVDSLEALVSITDAGVLNPQLTSVENVNYELRDGDATSADTTTLRFSNSSGVNNLELDNYANNTSDDTIEVEGLSKDDTFTVANDAASDADNDYTFTFRDAGGTDDAATVNLKSSVDATLGTVTVNNIENVTVASTGAGAATYTVLAASAETVNIDSTPNGGGTVDIDAAAATTLNVTSPDDITVADVVDGGAEKLGELRALNITSETSGKTVTATGLEIDATGSADSVVATIDGEGDTTLSFESGSNGDALDSDDTITVNTTDATGTVTYTAQADAVEDYNGGAGVDDVTLVGSMAASGDFDLGGGNDILNATSISSTAVDADMGAGNDTVKAGDGQVGSNDVFEGGSGDDTVEITATADTFNDATFTGIENVEITSDGDTDSGDLADFDSDLTEVTVVSTADGDDIEFDNADGESFVLTNTDTGTGTAIDYGKLDVDFADLAATTAVDVTVDNKDTDAKMVVADIDVDGAETLNLDVATANSIDSSDEVDIQKVVGGSTLLDVDETAGSGPVDLNMGGGTALSNATINTVGVTGNVTLDLKDVDLSVTTGSGNDKIIFDSGNSNAQVIKTGAGDDTFEVLDGGTFASGDSFTGGSGADTFDVDDNDLDASSDLTNVTVSGIDVIAVDNTSANEIVLDDAFITQSDANKVTVDLEDKADFSITIGAAITAGSVVLTGPQSAAADAFTLKDSSANVVTLADDPNGDGATGSGEAGVTVQLGDSGDTVTGGASDDTILATAGSSGEAADLEGDVIDGKGGDDIVKVGLDGDITSATEISNVETVEIDYQGANDFDATNVDSSAKFVVNGTGGGSGVALDLLNIESGATVEMNRSASDDVLKVTLEDDSGPSDSLDVKVTGSGNFASSSGIVTGSGLETLNLTIDGSGANDISSASAIKADRVVVKSGESNTDNLDVGTLDTNVSTVDASAFAGDLTVISHDGTAQTIDGGAGADTITMNDAADDLDGGTGSSDDKLKIATSGTTSTEDVTVDLSASGDQVTEFEGSSNATVQSGFEDVDLSGYTGSGNARVIANDGGSTITGTANADVISLGDGDDTVDGGSGVDTFKADAAQVTAADTIDGGGGSDVLELTADDDSTGAVIDVPVSLDKVVLVEDGANDIKVALTYASANSTNMEFDGTGITNAGADITIDASDDEADGDYTIKGGVGDDILKSNDGADTIKGGVGIDTISLGASDSAVDVVQLETGAALTSGNRDTVLEFNAGNTNGDIIGIKAADITGSLSNESSEDYVAAASFATGAATSGGNVATIANADASKIVEIANDASNQADLSAAVDGSELVKYESSGDTSIEFGGTALSDGDAGFIVAYDNGDAYVYHFDNDDGTTTQLAASEIQLVTTIDTITADALTHDNFGVYS